MGTKVLIKDGRGYLLDPESGETHSVDQGEISAALMAGYVPATKPEATKLIKEETYGTVPYQISSALAGVARGGTFGLSDLLFTKTGAMPPEALQILREVNPASSLTGDIIGSIGSFMLPVGPGAALLKGATKTGQGVQKLAARGLQKSADSAIPRLSGGLLREGTIGAGIGAGQGLSDAVLRDLSAGDALNTILASTGEGAALGGTFGGAGWALSQAGRKLRGRYTLNLKEMKTLRNEQKSVQAELKALRLSGAPESKIARREAQLAEITTQLAEKQTKAISRVFGRALAFGIGHTIGGGVTGGLIGVLVAPRAMKALRGALKPLGKAVSKASTSTGKWWDKVRPYAQAFSETPLGKAAAQAAREKATAVGQRVAGTQAGQVTLESLGHAGGAALGTLATVTPEAVASGAMAGGAHGAALGLGAHFASKPLGRIVEILANKVAPASKIAAFKGLSNDETSQLWDEVNEIHPEQATLVLESELGSDIPSDMATGATERMNSVLSVLQGANSGSKKDIESWKRKFLAIASPDSFIESLADGKLTREQVDAWQAAYPEALEQLKSLVQAAMADVKAGGGKYSKRQARQFSLLVDNEATQMYNAERVAAFQQMHEANRQQAQQRRGKSVRVAGSYETRMQRLQGM